MCVYFATSHFKEAHIGMAASEDEHPNNPYYVLNALWDMMDCYFAELMEVGLS